MRSTFGKVPVSN
jgi:hypothetical protein